VTGTKEGAILSQSKSNKHRSNRVLAGLSAEEYRRIEPNLEPVSLTFGEIIYQFKATSNTLRLTQEFLSWMLGVRNQVVSRAAMRPQHVGAIKIQSRSFDHCRLKPARSFSL
jgi:hypothetical protein